MPFTDLTGIIQRGIRSGDTYDGQPSIAKLKGLACRNEGLVPIEYPVSPISFPVGYGSNLLNDGNFSTKGDWTYDAGWLIQAGLARHPGSTAGTLQHPVDLPAGKYRFSGVVTIHTPSEGTYVVLTIGEFTSRISLSGNFKLDFELTNGATTVQFYGPGGSNEIYVDSLSIQTEREYDFPFPNLWVGKFSSLLGFRDELMKIEITGRRLN